MSKKLWYSVLIGNILIEVILTVLIPNSREYFFNILEVKAAALVWIGLGLFLLNIFLLDIIQTLKPYLILRYGLKLREDKTELHKDTPKISAKIDNPAQRVQEDIKLSIMLKLQVYTEYWISGLIVVYLIVINFNNLYLCVGALTYSVICIIIAYFFRPHMVRAEKIIQISEANFRSELTKTWTFSSFSNVILSNITAGKIRLAFGLFTKSQAVIMLLLPYLVVLPLYVNNVITLGNLMYYTTTFDLLVLNMAILINMFPVLTASKASIERVKELNIDK